ncbi:hypothetical protein HANVADRAFT_54322 [Hanseniaspora valbyensis NRRL Y-1626]|uniref:Uncharacterized protein n=1 Tax=Hanseniaspora valbyensis NRRL Y-1626 TaxID=766949 RepID=A0A1B7T7P4_9ASCO|nr:hypothetical protein HANVADRAFT_54322 [Hanseniaspora valbyensis NRRL Y-1626]
MVSLLKIIGIFSVTIFAIKADTLISSTSSTVITSTTTSCETIPDITTDSTAISSSTSIESDGTVYTLYSGPVYVVTSYDSFCETSLSLTTQTRF